MESNQRIFRNPDVVAFNTLLICWGDGIRASLVPQNDSLFLGNGDYYSHGDLISHHVMDSILRLTLSRKVGLLEIWQDGQSLYTEDIWKKIENGSNRLWKKFQRQKIAPNNLHNYNKQIEILLASKAIRRIYPDKVYFDVFLYEANSAVICRKQRVYV